MTSRPSVILVGIDGGTLDLVGPWARAGELPAVGALLRAGASGPLRSTQPPLTPVAWSSLLTGCSPARHGVFGFLRIPADTYAPQFLSGGSLVLPTIFELLSARGLRVGAINVPWTWPPRAVNGWWLSGLDAPAYGPDIAYPPGLFEELAGRFGGYFDKLVPVRRHGYALDRLEASIDKLGAMARYLARTRPVDLLAVVFTATDQVQHWFWRDRTVRARDGRVVEDLLLHTYRRVDEQIERIVSECAGPATTVLIASDHGAGPCEGGVDLNRWLAEQGWLRFSGSGRRGPSAGLLRLAGRLPAGLRERLRGALGGRRRRLLSRVLAEGVDWPATAAFCWSDYGAISVHREGRFAQGRVAAERSGALCEEIAEGLMQMRDPVSGERVMSAALPGRVLYGETHDAPDLLAVTRGYRWEILTDFTAAGPLPERHGRQVFGPSLRQATHRLHGLLCAQGRDVRPGMALSGARIQDVAATILHLLGAPVPEHMDGCVLSAMLTREALAAHPPRREAVDLKVAAAAGYADGDRARVERDLGALGYL
ncbi:MAG: alkaline phosphatase family protein [Armatimonadota bacterium]